MAFPFWVAAHPIRTARPHPRRPAVAEERRAPAGGWRGSCARLAAPGTDELIWTWRSDSRNGRRERSTQIMNGNLLRARARCARAEHRRRRPEATTVCQLVEAELETFLEQVAQLPDS